MITTSNGSAPVLAGERGVKNKADNAADNAANSVENQHKKPKIDLGSWITLGKHAKSRRPKIARRLPPYARPIADARARGLIPRRLSGVHLVVVLDWHERRTGAVPRIVLLGDPASFDLRFLAGLDVRLPYTGRDAERVASAVDALLAAGAVSVETVHHDLREAGAPHHKWLTIHQREELRHAA